MVALTIAMGFAAYRQCRWADKAVRFPGADEPDGLSARQRNAEASLLVSDNRQGGRRTSRVPMMTVGRR